MYGIPLDATVLLSVGELNDNKNHRVVIEALKELCECWYVICGRGPLLEEYKRLAKQLGVDRRVILPGYRDDIEHFYNISDAFVFPSLREGLPVAVIEAMSAGLPVVCTKIRGCSDLICDGENGFFIDANDTNSIVNGIRKAINNRFYLSKNNMSKAILYDLNTIVEQYRDLYKKTSS